MPTVSVIIPAYDAASAIDSALGSVASQTRPADQVIVVDDGSTDTTAERARRWETVLPLEIVRLDENVGGGLGAGGARAEAIRHASGDLLALLDVDDHWLPDHLQVMLDAHDAAGGLVTANHLRWVPGIEVASTPASELVPVPPAAEQQLAILEENFVFVSTLFSRELYDRVGPMHNIRCEDWDLWIRMIDAGATVTMPDRVTALYRQDPDSVSGTDKLLIGDIELLERHRTGRSPEQVAVIDRALRRRRAKQAYLEGLGLAEEGDLRAARRAWSRAVRSDPSLRGNRSRLNGRVVLRCAACIAAPRTMVRLRARRQADPSMVVGDGGIVSNLTGRR